MAKQYFKPGNMLYPLPAGMVSCQYPGASDPKCGNPALAGRPNILTVAWAGTVCTNPPMLSISVRPERYSYHMIETAGEFVVNLTTEALVRATDYCGVRSGRDVDKFQGFAHTLRTDNGLLAVTEGTGAWLSCKVASTVDLGTHTLFVADVTDGDTLSREPSATYAYYQANIKPRPAAPAAETGKKRWVCTVCGYIYEGETLPADFICPICKHPASDFEPVAN